MDSKIEFNKVTTLSKIIATVIFITLPFLGFYLGILYQQSQNPVNNTSQPLIQSTKKSNLTNKSSTASANIETANWKTYTSNKYNLSFKYPSLWIVGERKSDINGSLNLYLRPESLSVGDKEYGVISIKTITSTLSLEQFANTLCGDAFETCDNSQKTQNVKFGILTGKKISPIGGALPNESIIFKNKNNILEFDMILDSSAKPNPQNEIILNQILSTFKFTEQNIEESSITQSSNATLSPIDGWVEKNVGNLTVKLPPQATIKSSNCTDNIVKYEECYLIENHDKTLLAPPHISILIKTYQGGSRRKEAGLTDGFSIKEKIFGAHTGLDAILSCQISGCITLRHIVLVVDNKLIFVTDGIYKQSNSTTSLESSITNSIISSIRKAD